MSSWSGHPFMLPMPTRANNLVRPAMMRCGPAWRPRARLVKTTTGKQWRSMASAALASVWASLGHPAPLAGPVRLEVKFFFNSIASDEDGPLKALQDALSKCVWEDDRQIADLRLGKRLVVRGGVERAEIRVFDLCGDPEHQLLEQRLAASKKRPKKASKKRLKLKNLKPAVYR